MTLKIGTKIVFHKFSPYHKPFKLSGRNKAKCNLKHSLKRSTIPINLEKVELPHS